MAKRDEKVDEFGLTYKQRRAIRADARRIAATKEAVARSLFEAKQIEHELGYSKDYEAAAKAYVDKLDHLLATSYFTRPMISVGFFERLRDALVADKLLPVVVSANIIFAAAYFVEFTKGFSPDAIWRVLNNIVAIFITPAKSATEPLVNAATSASATAVAGYDKGFMVVALLAGSQLLAFCLLGLSKNAESRKFAADYLKVSLGVYVGAASKYLT